MPARKQDKRSFVTVLLTIAAWDSVRLMVASSPSDEDCPESFKRVSLKTRPNKGDLLAHSPALNATKETWDKPRRNETRNREGSKKRGSSTLSPPRHSPWQVRRVLRTKKAQSVAKSQANSLSNVCSAFVEKKGAATGYRRYLGHPFVCSVDCFIVALSKHVAFLKLEIMHRRNDSVDHRPQTGGVEGWAGQVVDFLWPSPPPP